MKIAALAPRSPRLHILEDDPTRPGVLLETDTIIADDPRSRQRLSSGPPQLHSLVVRVRMATVLPKLRRAT